VTLWYTADLHLDHPFMASNRGFRYQAAHDYAIVEAWNSVVKGGDCVVVCGDVFWETEPTYTTKMWKTLNGTKVLVKGNHDYWVKRTKIQFRRIYEKKVKIKKGGPHQYVVACHYPMLTWNKKQHGAIHVHGHSHGNILPCQGRMDIGVDVAKIMLGDWRPFSFDEVNYLLKKYREEI